MQFILNAQQFEENQSYKLIFFQKSSFS